VNLPVDIESQKEAAVSIDLFFELQDYALVLLLLVDLYFVKLSAHIGAILSANLEMYRGASYR